MVQIDDFEQMAILYFVLPHDVSDAFYCQLCCIVLAIALELAEESGCAIMNSCQIKVEYMAKQVAYEIDMSHCCALDTGLALSK